MRISDWSSDVCSSDLPTGRRGAGGVDGALFWRQLLSDAVAAERAADGAFQPGDRGAAHHAALSAQSPFPIQHAELHLHTGAAEADRPGQRHAVPPRLVPKIYAGWRADRAGAGGAGGRKTEALSQNRKDRTEESRKGKR